MSSGRNYATRIYSLAGNLYTTKVAGCGGRERRGWTCNSCPCFPWLGQVHQRQWPLLVEVSDLSFVTGLLVGGGQTSKLFEE